MMVRLSALTALLIMAAATAAGAGELSLTMNNGRVTLIADNVTVRQILTEWARVGQTKIVNVERVAGAPVTLRLVDVPERQALETVLRAVSGYLAAPRVNEVADASLYDRIMILPTSTPPPATNAPATRAPVQIFTPQPVESTEAEIDDDQEDAQIEEQPQQQAVPGFVQPRPPTFDPANMQPVQPRGNGNVTQPAMQGEGEEQPVGPQPFFGAPGTAARPGEIVSPPQQQPATPVPGMYPPRQVPQQPQQQPPPQSSRQ
jgi:hypothetical protein